ncbi:MAG: hypothetical protein ACRDRN_13645 [Sciscionella sp.]
MPQFDRNKDFARLAELLEREFAVRNMSLKPGGAQNLLHSQAVPVETVQEVSRNAAPHPGLADTSRQMQEPADNLPVAPVRRHPSVACLEAKTVGRWPIR